MKRILVSGLINLETTLRVDEFPVTYAPVRFPFGGVHSTVSGVGYNIARALTVPGNQVRLLSLVGQDLPGHLVETALARDGIPAADVLPTLAETAQSVILYEPGGRRQIHVDLKDIQARPYPPQRFQAAMAGSDLAVLCNISFNRPLLARAAAPECR